MSITTEQWKAIEQELKGLFGSCEFQLNDKKISVQREGWKEGQRMLVMYIDGTFNLGMGWPTSDRFDPITEKLWRKRSTAVYKPSVKKKIIKDFGERRARKLFARLDEVMVNYAPFFPKAGPLIRQLRKLPVDELSIVTIGGKSA